MTVPIEIKTSPTSNQIRQRGWKNWEEGAWLMVFWLLALDALWGLSGRLISWGNADTGVRINGQSFVFLVLLCLVRLVLFGFELRRKGPATKQEGA